MAGDTVSSDLVPFRWPARWTDPRHLSLFESSPINCLVLSGAAGGIAEAARKAGLSVIYWNSLNAAPLAEVKWSTPVPIVAITKLVWPQIKTAASGGGDDAQSGPTGVPWIDSNSWVARLAASRAPSKQIWLDFSPPTGATPPTDVAYRIAIADAAATGARWVVTLDDKLAASLAAGTAGALRTWKSILDTLAFFEKRKQWRSYVHQGPLAVVSTFAGDNEFMGTEFLNLAARRNLLYRIVDAARVKEADLSGLRAVAWIDPERPAPEAAAKLTAFAREGGLVIVHHQAATAFSGERVLECAVTGYELRGLGKGSIASAVADWDDPYFVAADVHNLVSRRYDPIRMFNGSSYWVHNSAAPTGGGRLVQLVSFGSFSRRGGVGTADVSLRLTEAHSAVTFHAFDAEPAPLAPVIVNGNTEYRLPQFGTYAALEVRV